MQCRLWVPYMRIWGVGEAWGLAAKNEAPRGAMSTAGEFRSRTCKARKRRMITYRVRLNTKSPTRLEFSHGTCSLLVSSTTKRLTSLNINSIGTSGV